MTTGSRAQTAAMAAALINTTTMPAGLKAVQMLARQADAYHLCKPYPFWQFRTWKTEDRGPLPTCMPLAKSIVNRGAKWLFGKPLTIKVAKNPTLQQTLRDAWRDNDMDARCVAMAVRGAREGGIFLKFSYDSQEEPKFSFQSLSIIDECRLFPHPHNRKKLLMARIQYSYFDAALKKTMWYREEWTAEEEVHYEPVANDAMLAVAKTADPDCFEGWTISSREKNPFGMIPGVHIHNVETDDMWGAGDLWDPGPDGDGLFRILDRMNLCYYQMEKSNTFDSEINPYFIDLDVDEDDIDKPVKPGQPVALESSNTDAGGSQGKVVMPEARGSLRPAMMEFAKDLRKQVLEAASSTSVDPSEFSNKGNLTSAVLVQLYQPQIEATDEKHKTYGGGVRAFLTLVARAAQKLGVSLGVTEDPATYGVEIGFAPYFEKSEDEKAAIVGRVQEEEIGGYTTHKRAVETVAQMEGVEDVDVLQEELAKEPKPSPTETDPNVTTMETNVSGLKTLGGKNAV